MNVLAISNSFGVDANTYLSQIAKADGRDLTVVTLYIGACPLERHYRNMISDNRCYDLYFNGANTGFSVSIQEALLTRAWDVVTLQQASFASPFPQTYQPYGDALAAFVRECCPKARLVIHQTWSYAEGDERLTTRTHHPNARAMFADIEKAYDRFAREVDADGIIPCGRLLQQLLDAGVPTVHRDGLHVTKGLGRYALGLLWYRMLTGRSVEQNSFCDFQEPVSQEEIRLAKACVDGYAPVFPQGI